MSLTFSLGFSDGLVVVLQLINSRVQTEGKEDGSLTDDRDPDQLSKRLLGVKETHASDHMHTPCSAGQIKNALNSGSQVL